MCRRLSRLPCFCDRDGGWGLPEGVLQCRIQYMHRQEFEVVPHIFSRKPSFLPLMARILLVSMFGAHCLTSRIGQKLIANILLLDTLVHDNILHLYW
jgi:hypothetical protein